MPNTHSNPVQPEQTASRHEFSTDSTLAKKKLGPYIVYTSEARDYNEVRKFLGTEMHGHWVGPMPVDEFMKEFLRPAEHPLPDIPQDPSKDVPTNGLESARYDPFITTIRERMPHLRAVNTSTKADTENDVNLKTDISIYNRVEGAQAPSRTNFSRMELWIEFKRRSNGVAFRDPDSLDAEEARRSALEEDYFVPDTVDGIDSRDQLAHYAGALDNLQSRHFPFSILIEGDRARFLRWDTSGTTVMATFNYRQNPKLMAGFLWRFNHLSARDRGHDTSITPANLLDELDARIRRKLKLENGVPLYKYSVPSLTENGYAYGPRLPSYNRSIISQRTRSSPFVWIPSKQDHEEECSASEPSCARDVDAADNWDDLMQNKGDPWGKETLICLRDTWRFLTHLPNVNYMPEGAIYKILRKKKTPNISEHVAGGDIAGGETETQNFVDASWLCVKPRITRYHHYRLIHGIVGRTLVEFNCTKELVTAVLDALKAHSHAYEVTKILHRDISAGNIILTDEGRGLLIDWEMAKYVDEIGSRRPDRTSGTACCRTRAEGTWQFMSADLLKNPGKRHKYIHDLESFLHVLGWTTLRYVPAVNSYRPAHRQNDMLMFDEHVVEPGMFEEGGNLKRQTLGSGLYPSTNFQPQKPTPLSDILEELGTPFISLYHGRPPTTADRMRISTPANEHDKRTTHLALDISRYDDQMEQLQSASFFTEVMTKALDEKVWPVDDKAAPTLPIGSDETYLRQKKKANQRAPIHTAWDSGKDLSRGMKRAASPTPEPGSKRTRGTPATSGTRM